MTVSAPNPWRIALALYDPKPHLNRYLHDPVAWAHDMIDWRDGGLAPYQEEVLAALVEHGRAAVRGPHGLGKTMETSIAVLWFATTRDDAGIDWKVPTTASAWRQLEHYLWPEIRKWARRIRWDRIGRKPFTQHELLQLNLKLNHGEAFAVASNDHEKIEGVHADSVLYIFDEAKAIPADTFDAAEGAFSGAGNDTAAEAYGLAQSTPGDPSGRFYEIHQRKAGLEDWWVRHVTLDEVVAAGRVSLDWAEQRARQWGVDSAVYANRVLGEFHSSDEDSVIPLAWIEQANDRWREWDEAGRPGRSEFVIVGVDVARGGADDTILAPRFGDRIDELRRSSLEPTTATTGRVAGLLRSFRTGRAVVDVIGVGAGVVDQLREQAFEVQAFNAAEGTKTKDRSGELGFINKRAAAWWGMRERLDPSFGPAAALPPDDLLTGDLTAPKWSVTASGKIQVESKKDIAKRIGRSTDAGDAVIQAFWEERESVARSVDVSDRRLTTGRRAR